MVSPGPGSPRTWMVGGLEQPQRRLLKSHLDPGLPASPAVFSLCWGQCYSPEAPPIIMPSASFVWGRGSCEHCESQGLGEAGLLGGGAHVHPSAPASKAWSLPGGQLQWGHSWTKLASPLVAAGLTDPSDPAPSHPCDSALWVPASGSHVA